jgi:hypothetical protein
MKSYQTEQLLPSSDVVSYERTTLFFHCYIEDISRRNTSPELSIMKYEKLASCKIGLKLVYFPFLIFVGAVFPYFTVLKVLQIR